MFCLSPFAAEAQLPHQLHYQSPPQGNLKTVRRQQNGKRPPCLDTHRHSDFMQPVVAQISLLRATRQRSQVKELDELVLQRLWFQVNQGVLKKVKIS